jgi:hypothetical protein
MGQAIDFARPDRRTLSGYFCRCGQTRVGMQHHIFSQNTFVNQHNIF